MINPLNFIKGSNEVKKRGGGVAKIKDPNRDKAKELYLNNKDITNREIAKILGVDEKKIATWKSRDNWNCSTTEKKNEVQQNKKCSTTNNKSLIKQAKTMVVEGSTIKEAAEKTGLKESTLQNYSSKENWMEQQEKFLKKIYGKLQEEKGEEHIKRRIESIDYLNYVQKRTLATMTNKEGLSESEIDNIKAYETVVNIVMKTIKGQSELLGIPDMKLNIRADKNKEGGEKPTSIQEVRKKNDL